VQDAAALERAILEQARRAALRQGTIQQETTPSSNANLEAVLDVYKRLWDAS